MRYLVIAILALGISTPGLVAQPHRGGREMMKQLDLNDEQAASLKQIRTTTAKQMIDIGASIKKKSIDLKSLMAESNPDRNAAKGLMTEIGDLKVERNMLMFDARQATMKVLTPEQQEKLQEMRIKRGGKMHERMKHRRGMRGEMMGDEPGGPPMGFAPDMDE